MPCIFSIPEMSNVITASDVQINAKSFDDYSLVIISLNIINKTRYDAQFDYLVPYLHTHKPVSLAVTYKKQEKIAFMNSSYNTPIDFDDEVSCGNFSICLYHKDEITTKITFANLHKNEEAKISIELEVPLFESIDQNYFTIPVFEYANNFLYPNYSFSFQNFSQKNTKIIQYEFNRKDHTNEITDQNIIEASNVSPKCPLTISIKRKKAKCNHYHSLKNRKNLVLFIDYKHALKSEETCTLILDFLHNYGDNYQFNIFIYGKNSNYLFKEMTKKSNDSMIEAENFLRNPAKTKFNMNFQGWYKEAINVCNDKEFYINTAAVCFGSFKNDEIIFTKTIDTYIVDTMRIYNSLAFAQHNNFHYINLGIDYGETLNNLLREMYTESLGNNEQTENEFFLQKISTIENETTLSDFKTYMSYNKLYVNTSITKLNSLIEMGEEKLIFIEEDFESFFQEINLGEYSNDLIKMMDENEMLLNFIKRLILIYIYDRNLFNALFDRETFSIDYFESIEKNNFISFYEENVTGNDQEERYSSSRIYRTIDIEQDFPENRSRPNLNLNEPNYYFYDQFCETPKDNRKKEKQEKKAKKDKKNDSFVEKKSNSITNLITDKDKIRKKKRDEEKNQREQSQLKLQQGISELLNSAQYQPQVDLNFVDSQFKIKFST